MKRMLLIEPFYAAVEGVNDIRRLPGFDSASLLRTIWLLGLVAGAGLFWAPNMNESSVGVALFWVGVTSLLTVWWLTVRALRLVGRLAQWVLRASLRQIRQAWEEARPQ